MEVEQMMAHLLSEIRTIREEMETSQTNLDANQAEMLARMEANMDINLKEMKEALRTN
jgi:hypothetical protein